MTAPILIGKLITLRPPQESDKADRKAAGRDPEVRRAYGVDPDNLRPFSDEENAQWYRRMSENPSGWMIDLAGRCIGGCSLKGFDQENRRARYAIGMFSSSDLGKGYGSDSTRLVLTYGFEELGLHRIDLRVLEYNERAIRCYEKCGFVKEGLERETLFAGGDWHGDVIMSILEDEYHARTK